MPHVHDEATKLIFAAGLLRTGMLHCHVFFIQRVASHTYWFVPWQASTSKAPLMGILSLLHWKSCDFLWNIRYTPRLAMVYSEYSTGNHVSHTVYDHMTDGGQKYDHHSDDQPSSAVKKGKECRLSESTTPGNSWRMRKYTGFILDKPANTSGSHCTAR